MKKIIFITVIVIFIPFLIVNFYKIDEKEEIKIKYMSNTIIRVKRMSTGNIDSIPFEEYIVGVLAGEMPIYFEKEAFKAQAVAARSYAFKRMEYNKDNDYDVVDSIMNQVYLDDNYLKDAWGDDYINNINIMQTIPHAMYIYMRIYKLLHSRKYKHCNQCIDTITEHNKNTPYSNA